MDINAQNIKNANLEGINSDAVLEMTTTARQKTWDAIHAISQMIKPGMREQEAIKMANAYFRDQGVKKFWHRTHVRFGKSTILSFDDEYTEDVELQENDIFYLDVGPVWNNIEGDCGNTFVVGSNPEHHKIKKDLKLIFDDIQEYWRAVNPVGPDLCAYARNLITQYGYKMHPAYVKGHRLSEFSHARYTNMSLFDFPDRPASERWIMELQICDPSLSFGAFYEDLLI